MANKFARGNRAYAFSQRSGKKAPYRRLVRDGQTGLLVTPEEYEPRHPQETPVKRVDDAIALRRPMPELFDAEALKIELPGVDDFTFLPGPNMWGKITLKKPEVV